MKAATVVRAGAVVAARPTLWITAVRQVALLAGPRWWRQWPPLPLPDEGYLRFRLQTAYGDASEPPHAGDFVTWLRWCKQMRALRRPG